MASALHQCHLCKHKNKALSKLITMALPKDQKKLLHKARKKKNPLASVDKSLLQILGDIISSDEKLENRTVPALEITYSTKPPHGAFELTEQNMKAFYQESGWGWNSSEKREELEHHEARYLVVYEQEQHNEKTTDTGSNDNDVRVLAGFCHFRFDTDDDDEPTQAVAYVYELQISSQYQRRGVGQRLMAIIEQIAKGADVKKVMLTVFKHNDSAMQFYTSPLLNYEIDHLSPSRHGNYGAKYEILSKSLN